MLTDTYICRLFAICPPLLWRVLALCVVGLRKQSARLAVDGFKGWKIEVYGWGQARIVRADRNGLSDPIEDAVQRVVLDAAIGTAVSPTSKRGIVTCDRQVEWVLGEAARLQEALRALSSLAEARSGQSPEGGQPALVEAFGEAKPAVSGWKPTTDSTEGEIGLGAGVMIAWFNLVGRSWVRMQPRLAWPGAFGAPALPL